MLCFGCNVFYCHFLVFTNLPHCCPKEVEMNIGNVNRIERIQEQKEQHHQNSTTVLEQPPLENGSKSPKEHDETLTADHNEEPRADCYHGYIPENVGEAEANPPGQKIPDVSTISEKDKFRNKDLKIFLLGTEGELIEKKKWLQFSEAIGYDMAEVRRKIGNDPKNFYKLLDEWLMVVLANKLNPVPFLYWAFERIEENSLIEELTKKFARGRSVKHKDIEQLEKYLKGTEFNETVNKTKSEQTFNIQADTVMLGEGNKIIRPDIPTDVIDGPSAPEEIREEIPVVTAKCPPRVLVGQPCTITVDIKASRTIAFLVWWKSVNGTYQIVQLTEDRFKGGTTHEPSLTITCVKKSDDGYYRCQAVTDTYSGHNDFYLKVIGDTPKVKASTDSPVQRGKSCRLKCTVTSEIPITEFYWFKNEKQLALTSKYKGGTIASPSLEVLIVDDDDTGQYQCRVVNAAGEEWSNMVQLDVGDIPIITLPSTTYDAPTGDFVTIRCKVKSENVPYSITWVKMMNDKQVPVLNYSRFSGGTINVPSLTIQNVIEDDTGCYICCAENQFGKITSDKVLLTVEKGNPDIQISVANRAMCGTQITIKCIVKSRSTITHLCWLKDNTRLPVNSKKYLGGKAESPNLTIVNLSKTDDGNYICQAKNEYGIGNSNTINLAVCGDYPRLSVNQKDVSCTAGDTVVLECQVHAEPAVSCVRWIKTSNVEGRGEMSTCNNAERCQIVKQSLTISNARSSDSGEFVCEATNKVGTRRSETIVLFVQPYDYPRLSVKQKDVSCTAGDTIVLECQVHAEPAVSCVRWIKISNGEGREMSTCNNAERCLIVKPSLTIRNARSCDSGEFVCEATNKVGTRRSETIVLYVQSNDYPRLSVKQKDVSCTAGDTIVLECQVHAEPEVSCVRWIKTSNGEEREMSTCNNVERCLIAKQSLTISNARSSDSGEFVCEATNKIGMRRSETIVLYVQLNELPPDMLLLAAEEDEQDLERFQADCQDNEGDRKLEYKAVVMKSELSTNCLNEINDQVSSSKVVFMLISKAFTENYWNLLCGLKNINSALYDSKPLIVPVSLEQGTRLPMGLKSAHSLYFYRRDSCYKEALAKFIRQFS